MDHKLAFGVEGAAVTRRYGAGQAHMRLYPKGSKIKDSYGTGEAMCAGLIPARQLRYSWRFVTCKICLRHKPKVTKC